MFSLYVTPLQHTFLQHGGVTMIDTMTSRFHHIY